MKLQNRRHKIWFHFICIRSDVNMRLRFSSDDGNNLIISDNTIRLYGLCGEKLKYPIKLSRVLDFKHQN